MLVEALRTAPTGAPAHARFCRWMFAVVCSQVRCLRLFVGSGRRVLWWGWGLHRVEELP